jgi:hypothetical protein
MAKKQSTTAYDRDFHVRYASAHFKAAVWTEELEEAQLRLKRATDSVLKARTKSEVLDLQRRVDDAEDDIAQLRYKERYWRESGVEPDFYEGPEMCSKAWWQQKFVDVRNFREEQEQKERAEQQV